MQLWKYSIGFLAIWTAHLGRSLGLFAAISSGRFNRASLADHLALHFPAVDSWCSAAIAFSYLSEKNDTLIISDKMRRLLIDPSDEENLGGQFSYLALKSLHYDAMPQLFALGKTLSINSTFDAIDNATEWDHYALLRGLHANSELNKSLKSGCDFLDLGCGTGMLLKKLAQVYTKSRLTGIDTSEVAVKKAKQNLKELNIEISCIAGESMEFGAKFDLIHIGEALYAALDKQLVLSNCFRALRPGGKLVVIEGLLPDPNEKGDEESAVIRGMQLDFALHGQQFLTLSGLKSLLRTAGFRKIKVRDLGGRLFMVTARK